MMAAEPASRRRRTSRLFNRAHLEEACSSLLSARHRTAPALIGIAIGVASVSSMISVGSVAKTEAVRQFQELGTDIVNIRLRARGEGGGRIAIGLADAEGIVALSGIRRAAPYTEAAVPAVLGGTETESVRVIGATGELAALARLELAEGRFVSKLDGGQYFCTVGFEVANKLREATGGRIIGAKVRLRETVFTVVGALRRSAVGQRPFEPNLAVFLPVATAGRITPEETLRNILAQTAADTDYRAATREIVSYFRERVPRAQVQVRSPEALIEQLHRQMRLYTLLLGAIGGISLLVGGIGVMNVMLVAVTERRKEIGVRRALGATRWDIQAQFLTESAVLSLLGGLVGVVLGLGATWGICHFSGWTFALSAGGTVLGAIVAGGSGIFFGFYPAHRAAGLDPVAALQGE